MWMSEAPWLCASMISELSKRTRELSLWLEPRRHLALVALARGLLALQRLSSSMLSSGSRAQGRQVEVAAALPPVRSLP